MSWDAGVTRMRLDGQVRREYGQQFLGGKGFAGEKFPRVHWVEPHGFTSHQVADGIATVMHSRGNRDSAYAFGGANPSLVPELPQGGTAIYDHLGNIVRVVEQHARIEHQQLAQVEVGNARISVRDGLIKLRVGEMWVAVLEDRILSAVPIVVGADPDPNL